MSEKETDPKLFMRRFVQDLRQLCLKHQCEIYSDHILVTSTDSRFSLSCHLAKQTPEKFGGYVSYLIQIPDGYYKQIEDGWREYGDDTHE